MKRLLWNDPQYDFAAYPGPMFRAVVTYVREENCAGLVYMIQYSVFDGISLEFFLQDFDALLADTATSSSSSSSSLLPQRVPFRAWIESEFQSRNSLAAQNSVQWHINRLRGIHSHPRSIISSTKSPRSGLKEIRRVGLMNLLENPVRIENAPHRKKKNKKKA